MPDPPDPDRADRVFSGPPSALQQVAAGVELFISFTTSHCSVRSFELQAQLDWFGSERFPFTLCIKVEVLLTLIITFVVVFIAAAAAVIADAVQLIQDWSSDFEND